MYRSNLAANAQTNVAGEVPLLRINHSPIFFTALTPSSRFSLRNPNRSTQVGVPQNVNWDPASGQAVR